MPQLNTPDFLFHNSIEFFEIGKKRTAEIFKIKPCDNPYLWYSISAPAVNIAFALELMLKTIILLETKKLGKEDKQHKLSYLFLRISEKARNAIVNDFYSPNRKKSSYPSVRFSKRQLKEPELPAQTSEEKIIKLLSIHDNSFVSWRYSFELSELENKKEVISFYFGDIIDFIEIVIEYIKRTMDELDIDQ